jgi:hypothetical protein
MQNLIAAGLLALAVVAAPAAAQTAQSSQTAPPSQAAKNAPQAPKKVWTNDDLSELRGGVTSATAEAPRAEGGAPGEAAAPTAAAGKEAKLSPEKDPKTYLAKLEPLRKQLADLDARIKGMQDGIDHPIDGKNAIKLNQPAPNLPPQDQPPGYDKKRPDDALYGNQVVRPQDQLKVYQQQRDQIQQQIDDLEAQARDNGIPPGDIRSP